MGGIPSVAAVFSLNEIQAGGEINLQLEEHHHYPAEQQKEEIQPIVEISHLPEPTTALIGRKTELAQLTEAFLNSSLRLAIIVAAGGIGKSALTDEWLQQIAAHNYYGKTRVFGWSFYSQGSHSTFANSQPFFSAVLPFLGATEIPIDEIEKARLLSRCLQQQPCLLILDGLEPLQYAENMSTMNGELQDSALKEFIACFRRAAGRSFILFSSRQPLVELKRWQAEHYLSLNLKTLPHKDGAALLQALEVKGNAEERQLISEDLNGHALSLVLMGHLLSEYHQGDCRYAKELLPLTSAHGGSDAEKDSRHALRVLDYYDSLQDDNSRCFLQLLGLFDRPMSRAESIVLIAQAEHAEPLRALKPREWQAIEQRLEKSGLLLGKKGCFERFEWDTHPIIRSYFGQKFKDSHPESFKQAHLVLFDYYQKLPEQELPDTLEEMQPLYRAVVHGCLAGEYLKALDNVFLKRIWRGGEYYSTKKLGSYSQDLIGLSAFFPQGWSRPVNNDLPEHARAALLSMASFCLMCLGWLEEAARLRQLDIGLHEELKEWMMAANSAENHTDLLLSLGKLRDAKDSAQIAIEYSQLSGEEDRRITSFGRLATVLYHLSDLHQALHLFEKAESLFREFTNGYSWLTSLAGIYYCSYFLDTATNAADLKKVLARGKFGLKIAEQDNHPIDIAFSHLILARTYQALQRPQIASTEFDLAVQSIQKIKLTMFMPEFYLARADFHLTQNQSDQAKADLNSAWEIIERSDMKMYAVNYLLIHGYFSLATADHDTASKHYEEAKQLIQETGYHLRDAELYLFGALLCQQQGSIEGKRPVQYLQKAKNRIEEIGQWGLMPRWEKVADLIR